MQGVKKICLSCRYFRLESVEHGICRVDKKSGTEYPVKQKDTDCLKWHDGGQQYFIRLGWIKAKAAASK